MTPKNNIESKLAKIPSIIVHGHLPYAKEEARNAVKALSREDLVGTLDQYLNDKRLFYNGFGCEILAEDFALEQVGNLALKRRDFEILNRVSTRYKELAESATDEVDKEDFLSAASHYEVRSK